jgi:tetratricopeptide (TPR) repeat protein
MQKFVTDSGNNPMAEDGRTFLKMTADGEAGLSVSAADVENQLKAKPAYVPALMLRGASEAKRGDRNSAIQVYAEVLRQYPKFAPAQVRLAALYLQSPETRDQGHELATAALKAMPDDGQAMRTAAESSYHRKEFANVVRLLEEAEKKGELNARELFIFGMSQRGMKRDGKGNLQKAIAAGLQEPDLGEANRALSEKPLANQ